ncbi:MAG TPA: hypothetical protein VHT96_06760 [Clostridia bacterium]|nr:hypothetical protein [Clostridia bacterium]
MSVRMMGSRKNSRLVMILVIVLLGLAVLIMPVYGMYRINMLNAQHKSQLDDMQARIDAMKQQVDQVEQMKRSVYVPKEDIGIFTVIKKEMFNQTEVYSSIPQELYINEDDFGKMTTIALKKELPVLKSVMASEKVNSDIREEEFNMFVLPSNLKKDELVDVRVTFPNGEDYIVLSKKKIYDLNQKTNTVWVWLNETEIHRIGSSIIDAYLNPGSKLYILKYVQPETQDELIPTYIANENVQTVMKGSPNILKLASRELALEVRKQLDERMKAFKQESAAAVESKLNADLTKRQQTGEAVDKAVTEQEAQQQQQTQTDGAGNGEAQTGQEAEQTSEAIY